jgi:hypothetical protein
MERIDVHDLPEEEAQLVAMFVEFLRQRRQEQAKREAVKREEACEVRPFAVWPLGVKGTLSREEIYEHL